MKLISEFYFPWKILGLFEVWQRQTVYNIFCSTLHLFLLISGNSIKSHFSSELNQFIMCSNKHLKLGDEPGCAVLFFWERSILSLKGYYCLFSAIPCFLLQLHIQLWWRLNWHKQPLLSAGPCLLCCWDVCLLGSLLWGACFWLSSNQSFCQVVLQADPLSQSDSAGSHVECCASSGWVAALWQASADSAWLSWQSGRWWTGCEERSRTGSEIIFIASMLAALWAGDGTQACFF